MATVQAGENATATQANDITLARNYLINSNFDIWQRNTTKTNPSNNEYVADRFAVVTALDGGTPPSNIIHSRQALTPGAIEKAYYHYRINPDGAGSGFGADSYHGIVQRIENGVRLLAGSGKTITVSFWARSSIGSKKLGIYVEQYYGTGGSPSSAENITGENWTLSSSWTKYTKTFTLNTLSGKTFGTNNDDQIILWFFTQWGSSRATRVGAGAEETHVGSGTIDIAQVQITIGDTVLEYKPKLFDEELDACMRYFEKTFSYATVPASNVGVDTGEVIFSGSSDGSGLLYLPYRFRKPKRNNSYTITFYEADGATAVWDYQRSGAAAGATPEAYAKSEYAMSVRVNVGANFVAAKVYGHLTIDNEL